ncbi:hypothetical protein D5086_018723 [Populus alba]|uniref:Uncharacterized protein n=1 Tax=Populus alba TaxID=43335 RepID=A0ACC4BQG1_POPAL
MLPIWIQNSCPLELNRSGISSPVTTTWVSISEQLLDALIGETLPAAILPMTSFNLPVQMHIHVFVFLAKSCFPANQINRLEKNPKICEAITKKFAECLLRAEEIGTVLDEGGPGPSSRGDAAVARRLGTKPEDGEDGDDPGKIS